MEGKALPENLLEKLRDQRLEENTEIMLLIWI
jgi:hypothetical protein